ncbi:O-phosphoseryl-tRNA selenium transferase [Hyaloraphidium curvatum]|nr:O-phosphoseryl-tRNA selenium transferase [Hyaloraphidium curvatum]
MDEGNFQAAAELIRNETYIQQARQSRKGREQLVRQLLHHRTLPEKGWSDAVIEAVLAEISAMDSNNFEGNVGLGEREARVFSSLVAQRHYRFGHGIGRSGDIAEVQPKAAGSSLIQKLTNYLVTDALRIAGASKPSTAACIVFPMATGMTLALALRAIKNKRGPKAKYVVMPRIDQKSCMKAILTAGLEPIFVENVIQGDEVRTDLQAVEAAIRDNPDSVVCVYSTTSCFAPRVPDALPEIAVICAKYGVGHLINNAYGVQSSKCMHLVSEACRIGKVDLWVQSTDKNFMVPIGGAVVSGPDKALVESMGKLYPGRASMSPILDLFITLLSMGSATWKEVLKQRKESYTYLHGRLNELAVAHGAKLLDVRKNDISLALSLSPFDSTDEPKKISFLGSMLFSRFVSGTRVVPRLSTATPISGLPAVEGWMSHCRNYPVAYLTAAAAVGLRKEEVDDFIARLDKVLAEFRRSRERGET